MQEYLPAPGSSVPYIPCPLGDAPEEYSPNVKDASQACMERGWRFHPDSHQSFSGMPGEPRYDNEYKNKQHEKAMKAEIKDPSDAIRKAGW